MVLALESQLKAFPAHFARMAEWETRGALDLGWALRDGYETAPDTKQDLDN